MGILKNYGRWADWEHDVLSKVEKPVEVQALIQKRQLAVDDDEDERDVVSDCIRQNIKRFTSPDDIDKSCYRIPVTEIAKWVKEVKPDKGYATKVSPYLRTLGITELTKAKRNASGCAWNWRGAKASKDLTPRPLQPSNSLLDEDD